MSDLESFDVAELGHHAESLADLASAVGATVDRMTRPPNPAMYGALMSPLLTGVMSGISAAAGQYLQGATHAIGETAAGMRQTRDAYAAAERANAEAARHLVV